MPVNIIIGIASIVIALVLYSSGVLGAFRAGIMEYRHLILIWVGFAFDVIATALMTFQAKGFLGDPHTVLGLIGIFGMLVVAIIVSWAIYRSRKDLLVKIARWALVPWAVWVISFIWGLVVRGLARMIH